MQWLLGSFDFPRIGKTIYFGVDESRREVLEVALPAGGMNSLGKNLLEGLGEEAMYFTK